MFNRWLKFPENSTCMLLGARRVGKTTLLRQRFPDAIYYTLDDFDVLRFARTDPKGLIQSITKSFAIIDEIQRCPELLIAVKYAIDTQNKTFIMTGSSALGLLSQGVETLAGRMHPLELPTACWGEELGPPTHECFNVVNQLQAIKARRQLKDSIIYGGFPEVINCNNAESKQEILHNYKNSYFAKDLALLSNVENADGLMAILSYLAISLGSHTSVVNAARESALSYPTARKYLNVLEASRLVFKLYGYQFGPAKRHAKAAKYYFADNGILFALGIKVSIGQQLENFVIAEIEKRRRLGRFNCDQLLYYQSAGGAEIDIIIDEPSLTTAIEIKNTINPAANDVRHLKTFLNSKNADKPRRALLLHMGDNASIENDVQLLPIAHLWRSL
ncbi:MAG: ATP-binding protein [Deltaproteobacteria bacterium]|nr:ATP-binding protein [Deltaproteobacteria bacterium]